MKFPYRSETPISPHPIADDGALDAEVQRKIFGFTDLRLLRTYISPDDGRRRPGGEHFPDGELYWCYLPKYNHDASEDIFCNPVPRYHTNASADYKVLKYIRKHWSDKKLAEFSGQLVIMWETRSKRMPGGLKHWIYESGDYSRAALTVVDHAYGEKLTSSGIKEIRL